MGLSQSEWLPDRLGIVTPGAYIKRATTTSLTTLFSLLDGRTLANTGFCETAGEPSGENRVTCVSRMSTRLVNHATELARRRITSKYHRRPRLRRRLIQPPARHLRRRPLVHAQCPKPRLEKPPSLKRLSERPTPWESAQSKASHTHGPQNRLLTTERLLRQQS